MFNLIIDPLSKPANFYGNPVKTDFRQGLKYYRVVASEEIPEQEKTELVLKILFGPAGVRCTWDQAKQLPDFIAYYISGGKEEEPEGQGKRVFDFNIDHARLYAAFWQCYNINLREIKNLSWWEFLALFKGLSSETHLLKVIEIRGKSIPAKASPEWKTNIRTLKALYELDKDKSRESSDQAMTNMFKGWK
ncbi:MAG: Gp15 family bacteriophage protein [Spirochaetales bacterium]|nr:Gp15 family bacteriophage protein [Spirochaetales bacterium]